MKISNSSNNKTWIKIITFTIATVLLCQNAVWAAPVAYQSLQANSAFDKDPINNEWQDEIRDTYADRTKRNTDPTDSAWIYTATGKKVMPWDRPKLEGAAHKYLERAGKQDRIKRVWGHGSKGRQSENDMLGIIEFISLCAGEAGLPHDEMSIGLVEPEENDEELIGFSHLKEPGETSYMALTTVGGRYPYEGSEELTGKGKTPYTIYLRLDDVLVYKELGEEGEKAFTAKLKHEYADAQRKLSGIDQRHMDEDIETTDLINRQEEKVLRIKRLLQNKLIDYILHIENYYNDYQYIQDFILSRNTISGFPVRDEIFRKNELLPDWLLIRTADRYIQKELGINSRELIKGDFSGDNRFLKLLKANIETAQIGPLFERAAVKNVYLLLRAVEILSKDTDFMNELHHTVVNSIMEGPVETRWQKLLTIPEQSSEEFLNEFDPDEQKEDSLNPFLIWLGKKTDILPVLKRLFPRKFNRYFEPFLGSGAVFFHCKPQGSVLNDRCQYLINIYTALRDKPWEVIKHLEQYLRGYLFNPDGTSTTLEQKEDYYLRIRALPYYGKGRKPKKYDQLKNQYFPIPETSAHRAARMIFLNRTCHQGVWRFNPQGHFNVPFGGRTTLGITRTPFEIYGDSEKYLCRREMFLEISRALQNLPIYSMDYEEVLKHAKPGDFIYLDPPYHFEAGYPGFTEYSKGKFDELQQWKLARVFQLLHERGCYVMLSNYNTSFIRRLYAGFDIETVRVESKMANIHAKKETQVSIQELWPLTEKEEGTLKGKKKTLVKEVIIRNFINQAERIKPFAPTEEMPSNFYDESTELLSSV